MAIEATDEDIGRRVRYLDGTLGTIAKVTESYVHVTWDIQNPEFNPYDKTSERIVPSDHPSPTLAGELEFA
ncbi:MAG: hypothetical protein V7608_5282 [Hyphomicrobiales bacterium]|jgi:hypothetical protein